MKMNKLGWTAFLTASLAILAAACTANSDTQTGSGGTGGRTQAATGGRGGQGGQATATGGIGGAAGQGGRTTGSGGSAGGSGGQATGAGGNAGGAGGSIGQGGTSVDSRADAAPAAGGAGGQGGDTSKPSADAAEVGAAGTGGASGGDAGAAADAEVVPADAAVGFPRRVLLSDEGNRRVVLVDLQNPSTAVWSRQLSDTSKYGDSMRDLQLVGGDRVAISVLKGYVELDLKTGEIKKEVTSFDGVESLRRLSNGNTVLGSNSNGGVTLQEIDPKDTAVSNRKVTFTSYSQLRLMRRTPQGTFLLGVGAKLAEVNWDKQTVWEMSIPDANYVFQGLRLPNGNLAATSGYGAALLVIDPATKKVLTTVGGKSQPEATSVVPNFYAGFQVLANGHFVITNWEGHGGGNGGKGLQLLEYDPTGALVWKWKQEPSLVSSLHNAIVLDGLDTTKLHDDVNGVLAPVAQ